MYQAYTYLESSNQALLCNITGANSIFTVKGLIVNPDPPQVGKSVTLKAFIESSKCHKQWKQDSLLVYFIKLTIFRIASCACIMKLNPK